MNKSCLLIWSVLFVFIIGGCSGAQKKLEKLTESGDKKLAKTFIEKGQKYENDGDLVEALKQYELTLIVDPQNDTAVEKRRHIKKNIRISAQKHYQAGLKFRKKGKYLLAQKEFLTSLRLQPDHSKALNMLRARTRIDAKRYVIHKIKPGESLGMVAKTYYGDHTKFSIIGDYNNMSDATHIRVGQRIKVPEIEGVPLLVTTHGIQTENINAPYSVFLDEDASQEGSREKPEPVDELTGYRNLGIEHFDKGEYQEAIIEFDKALNANPNDKPTLRYIYNTHFQYAIALFEKKNYLASKKNFEASLKYNKDCLKCRDYIKRSEKAYMETHYNRGLSYFGNQQLPEAIKEWELVQALDPNYKDLKQNIQKAKTLLKRLENIKKSTQ